jgi:hypothetical protein
LSVFFVHIFVQLCDIGMEFDPFRRCEMRLQELSRLVRESQGPQGLLLPLQNQLRLFQRFVSSFGARLHTIATENDLLQTIEELNALLELFGTEFDRLFNPAASEQIGARRTLNSDVDISGIDKFLEKLVRARISLQRFVADDITSAVRTQTAGELASIFEPQSALNASLGRGVFGWTFRMENMPLGCVFAVKRIALNGNIPEQFTSDEALNKECEALKSLNHPNIARYFTSYYSDWHPPSNEPQFFNIVMELIDGGTLQSKIVPHPYGPGEIEIADWARQMASGLSHMHHMQVYHRDLKPDNVMLTGRSTVKIIDLGLASRNTSSASFRATLVGSAQYASYEKSTGAGYDGRDDVWAMGIIFVELLKGQK